MKKTDFSRQVIFTISAVILFLGFYRNQWGAALPGKFKNFQWDDQSLVAGRLAESRKSGIFSHAGLLGRGDLALYDSPEYDDDDDAAYDHQYDTYLKQRTFESFNVYGSQTGMQGMFFGALDTISPFSPERNFQLYRVFAALTFALLLAYLTIWFYRELGWLAALAALLGAAFSPWLTLFGRNLFYLPTFLFLPLIAVTYILKRQSITRRDNPAQVALFALVGVLLKVLFNGFDFILPSILACGAPFAYYALRDRWQARKVYRFGLALGIGIAAAIFLGLSVLTLQLWIHFSDFHRAIAYIASTFSRRTMGDPALYPEYAMSLQASVWEVLTIYFTRKSVLANLSLRFMDVILIFGAISLLPLLQKEKQKISGAFMAATWLSILSPLLWYVIFKGQAYMHPHTNFLSWYMPFMLYGYALSGHILARLFQKR